MNIFELLRLAGHKSNKALNPSSQFKYYRKMPPEFSQFGDRFLYRNKNRKPACAEGPKGRDRNKRDPATGIKLKHMPGFSESRTYS